MNKQSCGSPYLQEKAVVWRWHAKGGLLRSLVVLLLLVAPGLAWANEPEPEFGDLNLEEQWSGDYDGMVERRVIRVLVVPNKMLFFTDAGQQRGVNVDLFNEFEQFINERLKSKALSVKILFLPVKRDQLFSALQEGRGDIAAANLTITPERQEIVDFSTPLLTGVKEIVVTGSNAPSITSVEDLAGKELHIRTSSSYYEHVQLLNQDFQKKGLEPIVVVEADEFLEDSDLLEMVNADLIPMVIVDDHKAKFWEQIFENIQLHPEIAVSEGGEIGWAFRQNSPQLKGVVDEFIKTTKKGTLLGNIIFKRYLQDNKWARNALDPESQKRYQQVSELFKAYADQYGFDYLMTAALAYQESQLDHDKKSHVGAIGIMQLLPTTAADKNVGIADIAELESNIHAGHKYLRFLQDRYFSDPAISTLDRYLFTFAAYNAGPAKVAKIRTEAEAEGLDPNVWFQNVEIIAAKRIGRETVQYVSNIYKYYITYKMAQIKR